MKILAIHNYHRKGSASGDDQVYKSETSLLESHGHQVIQYTVSVDEFDSAGIIGKIKATFGMFWSFKHYHAIKNLCKNEKPDIVHVHTFFPLLSPSVLYAAKHCGCKVIATLHDTRFICPCATSLRENQLCNACGDGNYFRMVRYRCFKNSILQSLIVAGVFKWHRVKKSFYTQIDRYICLNDSQIELLAGIGFDKSKLVKKYNFVLDFKDKSNLYNIEKLPKRYVVFYGRIGEEKGIRLLMKIWDVIQDIPLVVMGGGPLGDIFQEWANKKTNVFYLGYTEHIQCLSIVNNSEFVVFPSICYEGCSMVAIETMSLGKGIVATDLGFSKEAIKQGSNGYKVPLGNIECFTKIIRDLWSDPNRCKEIGLMARKDYEKKYVPENNYELIMDIYNNVC